MIILSEVVADIPLASLSLGPDGQQSWLFASLNIDDYAPTTLENGHMVFLRRASAANECLIDDDMLMVDIAQFRLDRLHLVCLRRTVFPGPG